MIFPDKELKNIDQSQAINQPSDSDSSVSQSMDNNIENVIGEIASALFSFPVSISPDQDALIRKRKKKEKYKLKR